MKRLFLFIILATAQIVCLAQTNPKIESLYAYLKAKGVVKSYTLRNTESGGLRKSFNAFFLLYDDNPKPILFNGKEVDHKTDSITRARWAQYRDAYNQIRQTLADLLDEAAESYSYEYHQNGADTITTTIALKNKSNSNETIRKFKSPQSNVNEVFFAPEYISFHYKNTPSHHQNIDRINYNLGYGDLRYDGIVDTSVHATKDFDINKFKKAIAPILKDKSIKSRTMTCKHDPDFDLGDYNINNAIEYGKGFQMWSKTEDSPGGESNYTIYKITNESKAKDVLHQIMECARKHIAENPNEAYSICSDEYYGTAVTKIFCGANHYDEEIQCSAHEKYSIDIMTYMDKNGFYILINTNKGENCLPHEWKKLKSFINDKKVYYDDDL